MRAIVSRLTWCFLFVSSAAELAAQDGVIAAPPDTAGMTPVQHLLYLERHYFEATAAHEKATLLLEKGRMLKKEKEYENAYLQLKRSDSLAVNDTLFYHLRYETALCAYLSNDYKEAEKQLATVQTMRDTTWRDSCRVLRILVLLEREQWAESKKEIIRYKTDNPKRYYLFDSTKVFGSEKELHLKDRLKAYRMSLFMPGLGQMYAGKPWRGITNFVLVTGALTYGVITVIDGYYVSGVFTGLGVAFRFYKGGARYAVQLTDEYNRKKKREYVNYVKLLVL